MNDLTNQKRYFVVRDVTDGKGSTVAASGTIPATSPPLGQSLTPTAGDYTLHKVDPAGDVPTGASVTELDVEEARKAICSRLFNGTSTADFIGLEQEACQMIRAEFIAAQDALPVGDGDALFTALEPSSHALSAGAINIGYVRFNAAAIDASMKAAFNPLFETFFIKYPRDMT